MGFKGDIKVEINHTVAVEALDAMNAIAKDEDSYIYQRFLDARNIFFSARQELIEVVDEGFERWSAESQLKPKPRGFVCLRRGSDHKEQVFYADENGKLDTVPIREWANGAELYIVQVRAPFMPDVDAPILSRQMELRV